MKEARIDEVLDGIATSTVLVYLPDAPITPSEFLENNIAHRQRIGI